MHAPDVDTTAVATQAKNDRRMASIDGLRGIAALSVFAFHGSMYTLRDPAHPGSSAVGDYAVSELRLGLVLFFVLSGFLLSRPWFAAALDERRPPDLRRYLRARIARIAPSYYAALVGSIGLVWAFAGSVAPSKPPAGELPLFFVFAQNTSPSSVMKIDPPMWSLACEIGFYALLPAIGWLAIRLRTRRRAQALIPLALLGAGIAFNLWLATADVEPMLTKSLAAMFPYFALGMLAAIALHGRTPSTTTRRVAMVAGVLLVAADSFVARALPAGLDGAPVFSIVRDFAAGAGCAAIVGAVASGPPGRVLGSRVLAGIGTISYGVYLWHVPVLLALRGHGLLPLDPLRGTAVALVPTLAIATLSWVALERPIIAWAARRDDRLRRGRAARTRPRSGGGGVDARTGGREVGALRA